MYRLYAQARLSVEGESLRNHKDVGGYDRPAPGLFKSHQGEFSFSQHAGEVGAVHEGGSLIALDRFSDDLLTSDQQGWIFHGEEQGH